MATKVGGFTKSGVVQCVKLVEEVPTERNVSSFNGVWVSGSIPHIELNNGIKIIVRNSDHTAVDIKSMGLTSVKFQCVSPMGGSNLLGVMVMLTLSGDTFTASVPPDSPAINVSQLWEGESTALYGIQLFFTTAPDNETMHYYSIEITRQMNSADQTLGSGGSLSNNGYGYIVSPSVSKFELKLSERMKVPTVRMCKDGTLKCKELIEESSSEMFNGTVDSSVITLNNGMKITFTYGSSDTPASYTQTGSYLSFKDNTYGTPFLRLDINNTSTNKTVVASITNEEAWNSSEDLNIDLISGSIGAAVPTSPCKWVIEYKGQTDTYSISSQGPTITNAVGGHTLITSANRTPTVRVYKDGTIRCAEVEEATKTSKITNNTLFNGTWNSSTNTMTLNNGWELKLVNNDDSNYTTNISLTNLSITVNGSSNIIGLAVTSSAVIASINPTYTDLYNDEENLTITGLYTSTFSQSLTGHKFIIDKGNGQSYEFPFSSYISPSENVFSDLTGSNLKLTIPDRFELSWPGSTSSSNS